MKSAPRLAAAILGAACLSGLQAAPNILFVVADDLNCAIGPYGDKSAVTPNLDRLAARGLVFERAYCQQAVCNPSRASFLTGLRPATTGVDDLRKHFRDTAPGGKKLVTLPQHFKNHGWFCQNIGKMFHNMGDTQDRQSWSMDETMHTGTHAADTVFANTPLKPGDPAPEYKAPVTEAPDAPDTAYRDGQIARLAAGVIRDRAGSAQPFFLAVGFWRPHLPFVAPKKYWDLHDPAALPSAEPPAPPRDAPAIALHESREIRGYGGVPKDRPFTETEARHYRHGYHASISFLDAQLGLILDALEQSGQADKTIVVFTSDHGFHTGEHALWGKTSNFELDARVPLIIADPRQPAGHGKKTRALAELVDLYPTLAGLAGVAQGLPGNLEGASLAPVLADPAASVKDAAHTWHQHPFYGPASAWQAWGCSMRTQRWRYTEWRSIQSREVIARELYDHDSDPLETVNLASQPAHAARVSELAGKLAIQFPR
ncbi:MAG TPA: sulfatase [Prosthecobacter sp.]|nr:sulfatase [Prosthecobacter sp.]HRK15932.1 sulfatase [Prosthecobacter sp.]